MNERDELDSNELIGGLNPPALFFSNKLEKLFLHLCEQLFHSGTSLFTKRLIIVPSPAIKQWLLFRFADELGVATGMTMLYLTDGIGTKPPSPLSLTLWLAERLIQAIGQGEEDFESVGRYVEGHPKRVIFLAKKLAHLFQRYGMYGVASFEQRWQERLWHESRELFPPLIDCLKGALPSLHLFGHNHLPLPIFHRFEQQQATFYLLSPCQEFWSDLYSEARHGEVLQPLLVNLGRVGREMAKTIEESTIQTIETYDEEGLSPTQKSLLYLEPLSDDPTIEIHAASTPLREVEILYQNLLQLAVEPKDVLVMAPDITQYAPYLKAVFREKIHLNEMTPSMRHVEVKGLLALLDLEAERWSLSAVKRIYTNPLFIKQWNRKEQETLDYWIQETGIRWGYDAIDRERHLGRPMGQGTWKGGCEQLLDELAFGSDRIDFPDCELLGQWIEFLDALHAMLKPFYSEVHSVARWGQNCLALYRTFFESQDGTLVRLLEPLLGETTEQLYPFESIRPIVEELLDQESTENRLYDLQVIRCDSLRPMRALPAKVICLLGMNHDAFPRYTFDSLDALREQPGVPDPVDFDRYLFLETLLSYREKCLISYQGRDPYDGSAKPPSQVLELLLPYVKRVIHPLHSYHYRYFNGELPNHQPTDYALCLAKEKQERIPPLFHPPLPSELPIGEVTLSLADLLRAVRYPLRHYYQQLDFRERSRLNEEDPLSVSPLTLAKLRRLTLKGSQEEAIERLQKMGELPTGRLFEAALPRLMSQLIVAPTTSYEMHSGIDQREEIEPGCFSIPPLTLTLKRTKIHLVGHLEGIVDGGMILPDRGDWIGAIKWWPTILVTQALGLANNWTFSKNQKQVEAFLPQPELALEKLIGYYFQSLSQPSPLYPAVVPPLLKGAVDLSQVWDPALKWALETKRVGEDAVLWQAVAQTLYQEMGDAWF